MTSVIPAGGGTTDLTIVAPLTLSIEVLKERLNDKSLKTDNDMELTQFLSAAVGIAENYTGTQITAQTYTETHRTRGPMVVLNQCPVVTLTGITAATSGSTLSYLLAGLTVDPASGIVTRLDGGWLEPMTVTYTAGRTEIPPALAEGVYEIARHLYETTQRAFPRGRPQQPEDLYSTGQTFALPNRAKEFLDGYRMAGGIG